MVQFFAMSVAAVGADEIAVEFNVDTGADRKEISPYIYGINEWSFGDLPEGTVAARRVGGNRLTGYNWENNASNAGEDWYNSSDNHLVRNLPAEKQDEPGAVVTDFHDDVLASEADYSLFTLQMAGYVAADKDGEVSEAETAPSERWKEVKFNKEGDLSLTPDVTDDTVYMDEFVNFIVENYGTADTETGVKGYSLDNEPALWSETHPRIHPEKVTCDELISKTTELAKTVKSIDPEA
jgi:hypothetical protein